MNIHNPTYTIKDDKTFITFYTKEMPIEPDLNTIPSFNHDNVMTHYHDDMDDYISSKQTLEVSPDDKEKN
jgi:hypothetical protein